MDCHAMSAATSLQRCAHSFPPHHVPSRLHHGHPASQRLSLLHLRVDCHLKQAPFHNQGRDSRFGVTISRTLIPRWSSLRSGGCVRASNSEKGVSVEEIEYEDDEGDAWLVDEATTPFNQISVLELDEAADHELAGAYVLKLDSADLAHSVYWSNGKVWSGGCHDVFASLPPLLPEGPVGILGLGAGTVARLVLHIWPSLHLEGWEVDSEVVRVAREYFGLADLESPQEAPLRSEKSSDGGEGPKKLSKKSEGKKTGRLVVHVGDALGPQATVKGGFAGIMVDIFINGTMCKELAQVSTWRKLKKRLRSDGRIMVNCIPNSNHLQDDSVISREWDEPMHRVVRAMDVVFPGEVSVRELTDGNNVMLLSGELPDAESWSSKVPDRLAEGVHEWRRWDENHPRSPKP
ncbi:hypothetical protein KC19_9G164300 [Ceratodon purpureus]|uniref:Uncharacterized protein n=1 Tax=Ceratodon purpureus TaxID=3225 RepID=A0A8T0GW82_CERPU|nr:hypothetical protein KC19_9G164300 [Ceratodon purpureus]